MINNNSKTTKNTVTVSHTESSVYLKKSELPKDVSAFRNDAGYISEYALNSWLKSHSYLSRNEVDELIKRANLTVINKINKMYDDDAVARLNNDIISIKGEIVAIKDMLSTMDGNYISSSKENNFATKGDISTVNNKITKINEKVDSFPDADTILTNDNIEDFIDLKDFDELATKEWVESKNYLTKHQSLNGLLKKEDVQKMLADYARVSDIPSIPSLTGYAKETWVRDQGYITSAALNDYVRKNRLADYPKMSDVENMLKDYRRKDDPIDTPDQDMTGYVQKSDLKDYAQKQYVSNSISSKLNGYATEEWVKSQGYITETGDLSEYVKKTDLDTKLGGYVKTNTLTRYAQKNEVYTKSAINNTFMPRNEVERDYMRKDEANLSYFTKTEILNNFLQIEDYKELGELLKDKDILEDVIVLKEFGSYDDFRSDLPTLDNGLYIINSTDESDAEEHSDIYIVMDHNEIGHISDGIPQEAAQLVWKWED